MEPTVAEPTRSEVPQQSSGRYARIGIGLILLSGVFWFSLFAIPFTPLSTTNKALLGGTLFVGVQIAWWSGAALAGPRVVSKLTGWVRRKKTDDPD